MSTPSEASESTRLMCVRCLCRIKPRQLYIRNGVVEAAGTADAVVLGPVHVACPTEREIQHAQRMGRPL